MSVALCGTGLVEAVQSGQKERARLQKLLDYSRMTDELSAAEKQLRAAQKKEETCKVPFSLESGMHLGFKETC